MKKRDELIEEAKHWHTTKEYLEYDVFDLMVDFALSVLEREKEGMYREIVTRPKQTSQPTHSVTGDVSG